MRSAFSTVEGNIVQDYLEILLLKVFDEVISLPNNVNLKEYFLFTSYFLSQLDEKALIMFKEGSGKELCDKIFKLIQS